MYRHEFKYLISFEQLQILYRRAKTVLSLDKHADLSNQYYNVRSLYFDDFDNSAYFEKEDGVNPRKKYRIRIYNYNDNVILLECKEKEGSKILKSSQRLSIEQYNAILNGDGDNINMSASKLFNNFLLNCRLSRFRPVIIVDYNRLPFVYPNGNVRVTFDTNISSSNDFNAFFLKDLSLRPILTSGYHLMEVKFDEYLPDFIYHALQLENLHSIAFSKYYLCRKYSF